MSDAMTFAEAMALDPGEVEVTFKDGPTMLLANAGPRDAYEFWRANYRRSRPKRSRVQEMAEKRWQPERFGVGNSLHIDREAREQTVRAVCELLDGDEVNRRRSEQGGTWAAIIRKHFLEPR